MTNAGRMPGIGRMPGVVRVLPVVALTVAIVVVGAILVSAGSTLGYDLYAYVHAAERLLEGRSLYDPAVDVAGGYAIYLYPPPFALLVVPFVPLTAAFGPWPWLGLLVACFALGVAILPVRREIRWLVVLLAGLSWPFAYAIKLGQVGPVLFLCFAVGWRWLDRPGRLGAAMAIGTIVKLQPAILFAWALATGRRRAFVLGLAVVAVASLAATLIAGVDAWRDFVGLIRAVSAPITTPHNFTPGAIAYQLGLSETAGTAVQAISTLAVLGVVAWTVLRSAPDVSFLTAVTASQLISPLLWDHYAMLLLLPTAWLLERGRWWAVAIPLATSVLLIGLPPVVYPIAFWAALVAPLVVSRDTCTGRPARGQVAV
jgi:hypothetical protein